MGRGCGRPAPALSLCCLLPHLPASSRRLGGSGRHREEGGICRYESREGVCASFAASARLVTWGARFRVSAT